MTSPRPIPRVHASEIKSLILNKLGRRKAGSYFFLLKRFLSFKITKAEFEKQCCITIGKENVPLHNMLIRTILKNASVSRSALEKETNTGFSRNSKISNSFWGDALAASSRRRGIVIGADRHLKDRRSLLGPNGNVHNDCLCEITNPCDPQRPQELISIGSKGLVEVVVSVEDGEEVEQTRGSPGIQSHCPLTAPLGITRQISKTGRPPRPGVHETCFHKLELPDTKDLRKRMEGKIEQEGLSLPVGSADLLNSALDCYLKRIIKPCVELARARSIGESASLVSGNAAPGSHVMLRKQSQQRMDNCLASMSDFQVAMELNPRLLGVDSSLWREKLLLR